MSLNKPLKILGWFVSLVGIAMGFGDLLGWFRSNDRKDFYQLVVNSSSGIPISHQGAKEFMKKFPPPTDFAQSKITHITKQVLQTSSGFPIAGSLQYMNDEYKRSSDIASFEDVRRWVENTCYGWIALSIIFVGLIIQIFIDVFDWKQTK